MASSKPIRIGFVPEHYLLPLHLAARTNPNLFELVPFPSGTGHMITSLRSAEIDLAIGLTEGWVAGLLTPAGQKEKGYSIVGSWVSTPLRWAIVTGRSRSDVNGVPDLENHRRVGVSRMGSGSHVMAFVLAQEQGWLKEGGGDEQLKITPLGPFADLRDGVTGKDGESPKADFFMWEHFTTKPYFHASDSPLKKIGEIYTPWPSWHIAARSDAFPNPETDASLKQVFEALDQGIKDFNAGHDEAVRMLGTREAGCYYEEADAREWLKDVRFVDATRGVDKAVMENVVTVLKSAGVIKQEVHIADGDGVMAIAR